VAAARVSRIHVNARRFACLLGISGHRLAFIARGRGHPTAAVR
jgi:hypothetical protein